MSKIITFSAWDAQNLPSGISFDSNGGIFSGSPNVPPGEYTVPVSVQTNYGSDSKDITFIVLGKTYNVYAIGYMGQDWSHNAAPDEFGFYPLDIPKAFQLRAHHSGFSAYTAEGIYDCGVDQLLTYYATPVIQKLPISMSSSSFESMVGHVYSNYEGTSSSSLQATFWLTLKNRNHNSLTADTSGRVYANGNSSSPVYVNSKIISSTKIDSSPGISLPECPQYPLSNKAFKKGLSWLTNNGYSIGTLLFTQPSGSSTNVTYNVSFEDLGYRAVKIFDCNLCSFLSDDFYIDNNPAFFPFGDIKNAWFINNIGYVLTTDNDLYENNKGTWSLLGNWPISKLEILPFYSSLYLPSAFFLTDDGLLFHRGPVLKGICEAHDSFTQVFVNSSFFDFSCCWNNGVGAVNGSTLTVLKE